VRAQAGDVLHRLRRDTAAEHRAVEEALGLTDAGLTCARLVEVLTCLHGFWCAAEDGLDLWAAAEPAAAAEVEWSSRRRAGLYADDLAVLGRPPQDPSPRPRLPSVPDTDAALGRLYVLEGSTLGGVLIARHLAGLPQVASAGRLRSFTPYGAEAGARWQHYRQVTLARVAAGGDADRVVDAARVTFAGLAAWCDPPDRRPGAR